MIVPVGEAGTAVQAVIRTHALQPDVVLLDLVLPRRNGSDIIPGLLRVSLAPKVLVISPSTQPTSVRQAITAGARGHVPKQTSDTVLIKAVRQVASGERYVDPDLGAQFVIADGQPALEPISERERGRDVLYLLAPGYTNQESSKHLYISRRAVDTHRAHIMRTLRLGTRAQLVLLALASGLIGSCQGG